MNIVHHRLEYCSFKDITTRQLSFTKALILLSEKKSSMFMFEPLREHEQLSYLRILERSCSNIAGDYVYEETPQEP